MLNVRMMYEAAVAASYQGKTAEIIRLEMDASPHLPRVHR